MYGSAPVPCNALSEWCALCLRSPSHRAQSMWGVTGIPQPSIPSSQLTNKIIYSSHVPWKADSLPQCGHGQVTSACLWLSFFMWRWADHTLICLSSASLRRLMINNEENCCIESGEGSISRWNRCDIRLLISQSWAGMHGVQNGWAGVRFSSVIWSLRFLCGVRDKTLDLAHAR